MKKIFICFNILLLSGCSFFGIQSEESPVYWVQDSDDSMEIRHYYPYLIAQTEDAGDYDTASERSFFRLFDYISGKNESKQKIAMTAPVLQETKSEIKKSTPTEPTKSEKIRMTAPVFQEKTGNNWTMAFVLPSKYDLESAPKPTDSKITIKEIPEKRVAAIEFTGWMGDEDIAEEKAELLAWLKQKNIKTKGEPRSAGYNPPWTIPFLRQNEIHVDIE